MRQVLFVCVLFAGVVAQVPGLAQEANVDRILSDARQAIGGAQRIAAVKTFRTSGRTERQAGAFKIASTFEIMAEFHTRYLKKEVLNVVGIALTGRQGFNGSRLIAEMSAPPGSSFAALLAVGSERTPEEEVAAKAASLIAIRKEFARVTFPILLTSYESFPVKVAYGGEVDAPEGRAHVLDITGAADFSMQLLIDANTHLPVMASWIAVDQNSVIAGTLGGRAARLNQGSATTATPTELKGGLKVLETNARKAEPVEHRSYFSDYRVVDGIKLPMHITRRVNGKPVEEVTLESYAINPRLDPKAFEVK